MEEDYNSLKIQELKVLLNAKGLPVTGKKVDLVQRLTNDYENKKSSTTMTQETDQKAPDSKAEANITPDVNTMSSDQINGHEEAEKPYTQTTDSTYNTVRDHNSNATGASHSDSLKKEDDLSKIEARIKRFGANTEEDKQTERAKRFNLFSPALEKQKQESRLKRFGKNQSQNLQSISNMEGLDGQEEEEKRRKRLLRFGVVDEEEKLKQRAERFGTVDDSEKLKMREKRFKVA